MSWLRTAVNRAVEVGGKNNLTRTVRSYAGSVVAGGAKLLSGGRNMQNFRLTVKRLEEVSVSCRGVERVLLLRRWLVALKEIERLTNDQNNEDVTANKTTDNNNNDISDARNDNDSDKNGYDHYTYEEIRDSPKKPTLVYYYDPQIGEPMNFREVFLYSQALEGMTLSMILEAPNEEEVSLFLEIFRICLAGGKDVHEAVMSNIKNLARAFSNYEDEVLVKREELLQYARAAIAGIKINPDQARIDAEASSLKEKLGEMTESSEKQTTAKGEPLEDALGQVRIYSRLEELLLKKKSLSNYGDSPKLHAEKVDKLKVLSESLFNSTSKAEKRIIEHRLQKEEALSFRVAKANEVNQHEKELAAGIHELERQKDDLEAELKKVNASLTAARARLRNAREERDQFDEASNQILLHLKIRDEEISKSIASCRAEANVVTNWINFLEDTWLLQTSYNDQKERQVNGELERYGEYFLNLVIHLLSTYKEQLKLKISFIKQLGENLRSSTRYEKGLDQRKHDEDEYLRLESMFSTTLSAVDSMKTQFYSHNESIHWKTDQRVKELFDDLASIKKEFESIERPTFDVETPGRKTQSPSSAKSQRSPWARIRAAKAEQKKLKFDLENYDGDSPEYDEAEEIVEWEYDAFEKDLN